MQLKWAIIKFFSKLNYISKLFEKFTDPTW